MLRLVALDDGSFGAGLKVRALWLVVALGLGISVPARAVEPFPDGCKLTRQASLGFFGDHNASLRLRLRGIYAVRHREFPAAGLAR